MSTLANLLPHARLAEDQCAANLAASNQRYRTVSAQIDQLVSYYQEFSIPESNVAIARDALLFAQRLGTSIEEMKQRLKPLTDEVAAHKGLLQTCRARRMALEKLIEKEHLISARTQRKRERQKMDSLVCLASALPDHLPEQ